MEYWIWITTISATIIGFLLSEVSRYITESRKTKDKIESVRSLISIEIEHNLYLLNELMNEVKLEVNGDKINATKSYINKLIEIPFPHWKTITWEKQATLLSIALNESEIKLIYELYTNFDDLTFIYHRLMQKVISREKPEDYRTYKEIDNREYLKHLFGGTVKDNYYKEYLKMWEKFEISTERILEIGNPLIS